MATDWTVDGVHILDAQGRRIASAAFARERGCSVQISEEERAANLQTMAAARQMLEALRVTAGNIRSCFSAAPDVLYEPYRVWLQVVDAAIAKAEGR